MAQVDPRGAKNTICKCNAYERRTCTFLLLSRWTIDQLAGQRATATATKTKVRQEMSTKMSTLDDSNRNNLAINNMKHIQTALTCSSKCNILCTSAVNTSSAHKSSKCSHARIT